MSFSMIFAMDRHRVIGLNNAMPWHLPADLGYFMRTTKGHAVLMGRKTFESIGSKPLKNRRNVVITRDKSFTAEGCEVVHTLKDALDLYQDDEVFIIGGSEIYRQALPMTDKIYMTYIDHEFEGDSYFPEMAEDEWELVSETPGVLDDRNVFPHSFRVYKRVKHSEGE